MRATRILFAVTCCGCAAIALAENVGTTNDGGYKTGPGPKPKPTPPEKVLDPIHNDDSGAFGTKPKDPVVPKPSPIVPPARTDVVSSGQATLKATYTFDFESGRSGGDGDLFYHHRDDVIRFLEPRNGATLAFLPRTDYSILDANRLRALSYSDKPINASDNSDNQLRRGVVIAIKTRSGHLAKMRVTAAGRDLTFEWVTYR